MITVTACQAAKHASQSASMCSRSPGPLVAVRRCAGHRWCAAGDPGAPEHSRRRWSARSRWRQRPAAEPGPSLGGRRRSAPQLGREQPRRAMAADSSVRAATDGQRPPSTQRCRRRCAVAGDTRKAPQQQRGSSGHLSSTRERAQAAASQAELRVSVHERPSPPSSVSPGKTHTASKEGRGQNPQPFTTSLGRTLASRSHSSSANSFSFRDVRRRHNGRAERGCFVFQPGTCSSRRR